MTFDKVGFRENMKGLERSESSPTAQLSSPPEIVKTISRESASAQQLAQPTPHYGQLDSENSFKKKNEHIRRSAQRLKNIQDEANPREKSLEQLVETVNRKYQMLYGEDLVEAVPEEPAADEIQKVKKMDTEDFMKMLVGGPIRQFKKESPVRKENYIRLRNEGQTINSMGDLLKKRSSSRKHRGLSNEDSTAYGSNRKVQFHLQPSGVRTLKEYRARTASRSSSFSHSRSRSRSRSQHNERRSYQTWQENLRNYSPDNQPL